jgi:hypothetical protein
MSGCAVGLLIDLLAVRWFAYRSGWHAFTGLRLPDGRTGWQALTVLGPLTAAVCAVAVMICWLQATRCSPALPTVLVTLLLPVALLTFLLLAVRVLLDAPAGTGARAGAYLGLVLALGLTAGVYVSLRREGVADDDSAPVLETISVRAAGPRTDS